jgi:hypothetical protein
MSVERESRKPEFGERESAAPPKPRWKVLHPNTLRVLIREDICPECLAQLDTGYECNSCGFDALPIMEMIS